MPALQWRLQPRPHLPSEVQMSARLIRLIPTGEVVDTPAGAVPCMEPLEVQPLPVDRIVALWRETQEVVAFARALEAEHGIGRVLNA